MGKTIVWMSRHRPLPVQLKELERLFPKHKLIMETRPFSSADQIVKRFRKAGGDELIAVAPWSVIRELIKLGLRPIYAEMEKVNQVEDRETTITTDEGRHYRFIRFSWCIDVRLKLEPIKVANRMNQTVLLNPDGSTRSIIK